MGKINVLPFGYFSQTSQDYLYFCRAFLIHPVIADEKKMETVVLESVKKNWVDETNTTEYMQRDQGSFSQKYIIAKL